MVERYGDRKDEKARLDNLLDSIKKMMANLKIRAEQAMDVPEVNDNDKAVLQKWL